MTCELRQKFITLGNPLAAFDISNILNRFQQPSISSISKNSIQIAIEQLAGVGEVLGGIGDGSIKAGEGFIEQGDDALLL